MSGTFKIGHIEPDAAWDGGRYYNLTRGTLVDPDYLLASNDDGADDPLLALRELVAAIVQRAALDADGDLTPIADTDNAEDMACAALVWIATDADIFPLYCAVLNLDPEEFFSRLLAHKPRIAARWRRMLNEYPPLADCLRDAA